VVPSFEFHKVNGGVYEEADLIEEWCGLREDDGVKISDATAECVDWLREEVAGCRRQDLLKDQQQRSTVRKQMRIRIKELRTQSIS
jgi:hypothetical protein